METTTLAIEYVALAELKPDPQNVRTHNPRNLAAVISSLQRFKQQVPIVIDEQNVIRAGNARYLAAKELGWDKIACVRTGLSGADATAYAIADNRSGELADWDRFNLAQVLQTLAEQDGIPPHALGFEDEDLKALRSITEFEMGLSSQADGFAEGEQFHGKASIVIHTTDEELNDPELKNALATFCSRFGLRYRISTGKVMA